MNSIWPSIIRFDRSIGTDRAVFLQLRFIACGVLVPSLLLAACGGSPTAPPPPPPAPPANALPSIDGIAVKGRRPGQPARMADLAETVDVSATVTDAETPADELSYQWTATAGTFSGTGRTVTWTAPDVDPDPTVATGAVVTITLQVTERYGHPGQAKTFTQTVSSTQTLALHDSGKEVGDMSRNFLTLFSTTDIKDWRIVMQDFNRAVCPVPREVDDERDQVENHYTNYHVNAYEIGEARVTVNFGDFCPIPNGFLPGDACSTVSVRWDSTGPEGRRVTSGIDYLTAVYSAEASRWWLCSSRFDPSTTLGLPVYAK